MAVKMAALLAEPLGWMKAVRSALSLAVQRASHSVVATELRTAARMVDEKVQMWAVSTASNLVVHWADQKVLPTVAMKAWTWAVELAADSAVRKERWWAEWLEMHSVEHWAANLDGRSAAMTERNWAVHSAAWKAAHLAAWRARSKVAQMAGGTEQTTVAW